jgi:hypothetical protein
MSRFIMNTRGSMGISLWLTSAREPSSPSSSAEKVTNTRLRGGRRFRAENDRASSRTAAVPEALSSAPL